MNPTSRQSYDVVVMGGGPAGSTCATILAKAWAPRAVAREGILSPPSYRRVPDSRDLLAAAALRGAGQGSRGGIHEEVQRAVRLGFGEESRPFYFFETNHHESAVTWQVTRAKFDKILLDHARESGVEAIEGATVTQVLFDGDRAVGVEFRRTDREGKQGEAEGVEAAVTVDATGLNAFLSTRLGIRTRDPHLKKAVIYGYFKHAMRDPGRRRRRDARPEDEGRQRLVLVHPARGRGHQRRRRRRSGLPFQGPRRRPRGILNEEIASGARGSRRA
jgi:flavin-dependent dehydrogenase